jgi:hypothetical protein
VNVAILATSNQKDAIAAPKNKKADELQLSDCDPSGVGSSK